MTIKHSTAVVARRTKERPPHPLAVEFAAAGLDRYMLDDFPTPPWGARAWCEHVVGRDALVGKSVWEPAANRLFLARGLADYFARVTLSDIFDYGPGYPTFNFLDLHPSQIGARLPYFVGTAPDWIVTNPPFVRAVEFVETALSVARVGVAMLSRIQITEGLGRYRELFEPLGARWAWSQFVERLPMNEAICTAEMGTASAYGWLTIWKEPQPTEFIVARRHIPPCRHDLTRVGDYEVAAGSASVTAPGPGDASAVAAHQDLFGPAPRPETGAGIQPQTGHADIIAQLVSSAGRGLP